MHINVETDILHPLLRHKWGQSCTHSTTNERGSPKITTLLEPGATSDFMSIAARLIYSRTNPSHRSPQPRKPISYPLTARSSISWTFTPSHIPCVLYKHSNIYSAPQLLGEYAVLSVTDNGGQHRFNLNDSINTTVCMFLFFTEKLLLR